MSYDVIIIGAGPGGLACAAVTAAAGLTTLVVDRKKKIGKKVCAGGITWNGLLKKIPSDIAEKQFTKQLIFTRFQKVCVSSPIPMIATVNRERLGEKMAEEAAGRGVEIRLGCQLVSIENNHIVCENTATGRRERLAFTYLVGADGSSSFVRRSLGLPVADSGIGITYQVPGDFQEMEWHLDSTLFANGYAWIFPHRESASIGAYADSRCMKAIKLKNNLLTWADKNGYPLHQFKPSSELINFDFRGWHFANTYLIGDAAGLASGLTGEGIYSAMISGETVGSFIANPGYDITPLKRLIRNHTLHRKMVRLTGKNKIIATVVLELLTFCLRIKLLDFSRIEMAR